MFGKPELALQGRFAWNENLQMRSVLEAAASAAKIPDPRS